MAKTTRKTTKKAATTPISSPTIVRIPRLPVHCHVCDRSLSGGLDTFGDIGDEHCLLCWLGGGRVGTVHARLETARQQADAASEALATYQALVKYQKEDVRIAQENGLAPDVLERRERRLVLMRQHESSLINGELSAQDDLFDSEIDFEDALADQQFWDRVAVR